MSEHFSPAETNCRHCGQPGLKPELLDVMEHLRSQAGPITCTSGYRCPRHPVEAGKAKPGMHSTGLAADLHPHQISIADLYRLVRQVPAVHGIGVSAEDGYIHVDLRPGPLVQWVYRQRRDHVSTDPLKELGLT